MELIKDINKVTYEEYYDEERPIVLIEYSFCHQITVSFRDNCLMEITPIINENVKEFYRIDDLSELDEIYINLVKKHKYLRIIKVNELKSIIQREAFDEYEDKIRLSPNHALFYTKTYLGTFPRYIVEQVIKYTIDYIYETLNILFEYKNNRGSNIWNEENLRDIVLHYDSLMKSLDNVYYEDEKLDVLEYLTLSEFSDKYNYCKKHIDIIKAEYL